MKFYYSLTNHEGKVMAACAFEAKDELVVFLDKVYAHLLSEGFVLRTGAYGFMATKDDKSWYGSHSGLTADAMVAFAPKGMKPRAIMLHRR